MQLRSRGKAEKILRIDAAGAGLMACTAGSPTVSVPVLSSTTVSMRPRVSR